MRLSLRLTATLLLLHGTPLPMHALTLIQKGKAESVIVVPAASTPTSAYAAKELADHLALATGVRLQIVPEDAIPEGATGRIYLGATAAATRQGLAEKATRPDEYLIEVNDNELFILGKEEAAADPLSTSSAYRGTLFGVYEFLETGVGVRWLWPGALGTHVPKTDTLKVEPSINRQQQPRLKFRNWWIASAITNAGKPGAWIVAPEIDGLSFSPDTLLRYNDDLRVYLARQRMGESEPKPDLHHTFTNWWQQYGAEHPEWFMQNPDGTRGPRKRVNAAPGEVANVGAVAMCVSNPDLHRFIVEKWWKGGDFISLGEVDNKVFCHCATCLSWDGPVPEHPAFIASDYRPHVSTRYARFWSEIQKLAAKRNPNVTVGSYLYWNYLPAPVKPLDLGKQIYTEFVPWTEKISYYPMPKEADEWLREQWLGWRKTGARMAYRPNYFHGGGVTPHLNTWQTGEFLKFAYRNGMEGAKIDSLQAHWATRGPMLYMVMQLLWNPELEIEAIRKDYFAAFGPAAKAVERYFDYWEDYAIRWTSTTPHYKGEQLYNPDTLFAIAYPPDVFPPAERLLEKAFAEAKTSSDTNYAERVRFLQLGLENSRLTALFFNSLKDGSEAPDTEAGLAKSRQALNTLLEFRRQHEQTYMADLVNAGAREYRFAKKLLPLH